jgi:hypothetical protein
MLKGCALTALSLHGSCIVPKHRSPSCPCASHPHHPVCPLCLLAHIELSPNGLEELGEVMSNVLSERVVAVIDSDPSLKTWFVNDEDEGKSINSGTGAVNGIECRASGVSLSTKGDRIKELSSSWASCERKSRRCACRSSAG